MPQHPTPPTTAERQPRQFARWGLVAGTFVVGLFVGVIVAGVLIRSPSDAVVGPTGAPDASPSAAGSAAPPTSTAPTSTAPSAAATVQIVVNDGCLRAVNEAQDAYSAINEIGAAVSHADLSTLDHIIRQLQPLQGALGKDLSGCHVTTRLPNGALVPTTLPSGPALTVMSTVPTASATSAAAPSSTGG